MSQTSLTKALPLWGKRLPRGLRLSPADVPLLALGVLFLAAYTQGLLVPSTAGMAMAGLSLLVSSIVLAFSRRQLRADPQAGRFVRLAAGLSVATTLMAFSGDGLLLAAGWIAGGRLMVGLIGHGAATAEARGAARRASLVFAMGDLALVVAAILLTMGAGSSELAAIIAAAPAMDRAILLPAAALLVVAAMARCALPPFSSWLLRSLAAPTPVSALMHAGFVNAGGFLLIRLAPVLEAAPAARFALFAMGLVAALVGSAVMLVRSDVKGGLAASTVAQMGFMLLTLALGAYAAALWHMVAHGLFKAWLFLGSSGSVSGVAPRTKALPQPQPAVIALVVMLVALGLLQVGRGEALLPIGLTLAALLGALAAGLRSMPRAASAWLLAVFPLLLIVLNAAMLALMARFQPDAASPLISAYAQFGLLSLFLAAWVLQQKVASGEQSLPPALYARLIHAGHPAD